MDRWQRSDGSEGAWSEGASDLGILLAGLTGGAGIIHLAMVPAHTGTGSWLDPVGFAVVGWAQIALAVVFLLRRGNRTLAALTALLNAAALAVWICARTAGLPVGGHAGVVEEVGVVDGVCAALEGCAVVVATLLAVAPRRIRVGLLVPSMAAVVVLGLVTVGLVAPSSEGSGEAAGHVHGSADASAADDAGHQSEMAAIDRSRCDLGFNPKSFWSTAERMGVDTYAGGAMTMAAATKDTADPFEGRGSVGLDGLVSATSSASTGGELDAAALVSRLSVAPEEDYDAWIGWMRSQNAPTADASGGAGSGHAHAASGTSAAPDDNGGHGGHVGPTPWIAMTDQAECVKLSKELDEARSVALSMPTAGDAVANGYSQVTPYVPGIAAHYMRFGEVDGEFHIDRPEMLLYDGEGPAARVVGLSYYIRQPGDAEPTQGFTGPNDHYHRHVGLCTTSGGMVIGDSTTSESDCQARGGRKANGSTGWMSHVWVVPGCESPWGVFSGANPILDSAVPAASGGGENACGASTSSGRYDLRPGARAGSVGDETAAGD